MSAYGAKFTLEGGRIEILAAPAADPMVKVITDRRGAERRRDSLGNEPDRRRGDRRRDARYVSLALRSAGWVEVSKPTPKAE
jgi:hypothetical protein